MAFSKEDAAARQKAIQAGKTQYTRVSDGERYTIRNLGNRRHESNYGGQGGRDERYVSRSGNRGNKTDNPRAFNLRHGSPPGTDIAEGDRAMARVRKANPGMDADHINDISLSSQGASWKVQQGRGTYEEYFDNMKKAGVPVGHTAENLAPLEPRLNQIVKNQDTQKVHKAIKAAGSESDMIFGMFRKAVQSKAFRAIAPAIPIVGYGAGAASAAQYGVDYAKSGDPLDAVQSTLATAGMVPGVGIIPDVLNVGVDLYRTFGAFQPVRGRSGAQRAQQGG
jgi:hypothetical protein